MSSTMTDEQLKTLCQMNNWKCETAADLTRARNYYNSRVSHLSAPTQVSDATLRELAGLYRESYDPSQRSKWEEIFFETQKSEFLPKN